MKGKIVKKETVVCNRKGELFIIAVTKDIVYFEREDEKVCTDNKLEALSFLLESFTRKELFLLGDL